MFKAVSENFNKIVLASKKLSKNDNYTCPYCSRKMTLKQGNIMVVHFSHSKTENNDCKYYHYSLSESKTKTAQKESIYNMLSSNLINNIENLDIEHFDGDLIYDVYFELNGIKYAVIIQDNYISVEKYVLRSTECNLKDVVPLWIFTDNEMNDKKVLSKGCFFRQIIFKKHLSYMVNKNGDMYKGMEDSKFKSQDKCKYYMYWLGDNNLEISKYSYGFKIEGNWYNVDLAQLKVRK